MLLSCIKSHLFETSSGPYFALNSTLIIGRRVQPKHVNPVETDDEENFLKEFRMRDEVKGIMHVSEQRPHYGWTQKVRY